MRYNFRPDIVRAHDAEECLRDEDMGAYCTWKSSPFTLGLSYMSTNDRKPVSVSLVHRHGYICSVHNPQDAHQDVKEYLRSRRYLNNGFEMKGSVEEADVIDALNARAKQARGTTSSRSNSVSSNTRTETAAYEHADATVWGGKPTEIDVDELLQAREEAKLEPTSTGMSVVAFLLSLLLGAIVILSLIYLLPGFLHVRKRMPDFLDISKDVQSQVVDSLRSHQGGQDCNAEMYDWSESAISLVYSFQEFADEIKLGDLVLGMALSFTTVWALLPVMLVVGCPSAKEPEQEWRRKLNKTSRITWMIVFWSALITGAASAYCLYTLVWDPSLALQKFMDVLDKSVMDYVREMNPCAKELYKYAAMFFKNLKFIRLNCQVPEWLLVWRTFGVFHPWFLVPGDTDLFSDDYIYDGPYCLAIAPPDTVMSTMLISLFGMMGSTLGTLLVKRIVGDLFSLCRSTAIKVKQSWSSQEKQKAE